MSNESGPFVFGNHLSLDPGTAAVVEQIGMPALRHAVRFQDARATRATRPLSRPACPVGSLRQKAAGACQKSEISSADQMAPS